MHNRKGQAAMEFLMTYGWAILAAIIAIGVLAYFGVFNPSRLAGSTAVLNAPMNIPSGGFNILNDGCGGNDCINIEVVQNVGSSITISSANITLTSGATGICADVTALPTTWTSGTQQSFVVDCGAPNVFGAQASIAGNIEIKYQTAGSSLIQSSTGNVRGVAQ